MIVTGVGGGGGEWRRKGVEGVLLKHSQPKKESNFDI
jgi:hypothetical protein